VPHTATTTPARGLKRGEAVDLGRLYSGAALPSYSPAPKFPCLAQESVRGRGTYPIPGGTFLTLLKLAAVIAVVGLPFAMAFWRMPDYDTARVREDTWIWFWI
jgi:hypothetical protein